MRKCNTVSPNAAPPPPRRAIQGAEALVWGWVRAGRDVLVVFRGSNSPQNWITDVTSLRTRRVSDFGGGAAGTNVAAGFYNVRQNVVSA